MFFVAMGAYIRFMFGRGGGLHDDAPQDEDENRREEQAQYQVNHRSAPF
jgi:hypothetical protein